MKLPPPKYLPFLDDLLAQMKMAPETKPRAHKDNFGELDVPGVITKPETRKLIKEKLHEIILLAAERGHYSFKAKKHRHSSYFLYMSKLWVCYVIFCYDMEEEEQRGCIEDIVGERTEEEYDLLIDRLTAMRIKFAGKTALGKKIPKKAVSITAF